MEEMSNKMNQMNKNMMEMLNMFIEYVTNEIGVDFESPLNDNEMSQDELLANFLKQDSIKKLIPKESSTKNKKEKDPAAPKRPKSSYIIFCGAKRDEIKKKNPNMKATEITSKLGEMWKTLNDKQKQKYIDEANKEKERYQEEMNDYVPSEGFEKKDKKKNIIHFNRLRPETLVPAFEPSIGHLWIQFPEDPQLRRIFLDSQIIFVSYYNEM